MKSFLYLYLLFLSLKITTGYEVPLKSPTPWLTTRKAFIAQLPKNSIVAEIGVEEGEFSAQILEIAQPKKLYLIDCWEEQDFSKNPGNWRKYQPEYDSWYEKVKRRFKNDDRVVIIKDFSPEVCDQFEDNYLDWVYIDANHSYHAIKKDIPAWFAKIKNGGFLCGHDYGYAPGTLYEFGVIPALNEFLDVNNLVLKYLTTETLGSWAVQKP